VTAYALIQLADRGTFFVEPGADAYEAWWSARTRAPRIST